MPFNPSVEDPVGLRERIVESNRVLGLVVALVAAVAVLLLWLVVKMPAFFTSAAAQWGSGLSRGHAKGGGLSGGRYARHGLSGGRGALGSSRNCYQLKAPVKGIEPRRQWRRM